MEFPKNISKYLSKNNSQGWVIETLQDKLYNNIVVIPALDELSNIDTLLNSLSQNSRKHLKETLVVIVVNNIISEEKNIIEENRKLLEHLRRKGKVNAKLHIGIVDASSSGKALPIKNGGVGIARKIGMDLSLKYFDYNNDRKKILLSLDADCLVSNNYLEEIVEKYNNENIHASVIAFEHLLPEDDLGKSAIINYEIFLRYYVLGLKFANSHFAYHSIGSAIACDVESYVKVGGMNNKKAGEDYYFLEKLAKSFTIFNIHKAKVFPSARVSNRVPFGTGPRIKRFLENPQNEFFLYSPKTFEILKKWLFVFSSSKYSRDTAELLKKAKIINPELHQFLIEQEFEANWNKIIENSKTEVQLTKQKIIWMDGFKTLKLIHHLRDKFIPNENMFDAIDKLFMYMKIKHGIKHIENIPSLNIQQKYLNILRSYT